MPNCQIIIGQGGRQYCPVCNVGCARKDVVRECSGGGDAQRESIERLTDEGLLPEIPPPPIDVVILSHNYGRFIAEAVESVRSQSVPVTKIVIVDDGSDDNTRQEAERLGVPYIRIDALSPIKGREAGFNICDSEFICFLDADDKVHPDYIKTGLAEFTAGMGIVTSDFQYFGDSDELVSLNYRPQRIYRYNSLHSGCVARRAAIETSDAFSMELDDVIHHDWAMWKRVVENGWKVGKNPTPYLYRRHSGNLTDEIDARPAGERSFFKRANLKNETINLAIPLSGRSTWTELSRWLSRQTWPHHQIRLLLFDTSGDRNFSTEVNQWLATPSMCDYPDVRHIITNVGRPGLADEDRLDPQVRRDVQLACAKMYNRIKSIATEGEYLWIVEDDIIPPDDAGERLMLQMTADVASVSGVYESRMASGFVVHDGQWKRKVPSDGAETCHSNGFGCVILRQSILSEYSFTHVGGSGDYDHNFYEWLSNHPNCRKAIVEWTCRCGHLSAAKPQRPRSTINCLIVPHPRRIPAFLESVDKLPIDKVFLSGFTELELAPAIDWFVKQTDYVNYIVVADDTVIPPESLQMVERMLDTVNAATAWCRLAKGESLVNLTLSAVIEDDSRPPEMKDYDFVSREFVRNMEGRFRVKFAGSALTGMRRQLWIDHPYVTHPSSGGQTDVMQSRHLNESGVDIWSHPDAEIEHMKTSTTAACLEHWANGRGKPKSVDHQVWGDTI